jgi:hypothetical protein
MRALNLQERFEASVLGRALISAFLVATLATVVVENLPPSKVRREILRVGQPYLYATGLDQYWGLFAPEPRRVSIALHAQVKYADGTTQTWRTPVGGALFGEYWDYHWQKWQEWVLDEGYARLYRPAAERLWRSAAEFIARDRNRLGRQPVRVILVRHTSLNNAPGHHPIHEPDVAQAYYSLRITPGMLDRSGRR